MKAKPIAIACDHAGYELKEKIKKSFEEKNIAYKDLGTDSTDSVDYPIYAAKLCKTIQQGECDIGILLCGTGIGMAIAANKHKGIRAACCSDVFSAKAARSHNDANVLCFGGRVVVALDQALELVYAFLDTDYEGGRHQRRIDLITDLENAQ